MLSSIFGELANVAQALVTFVSGVFTNVISLIYTTGSNAGLTDFGKLMLIPVGTTAFFFILRWVSRLVKPRL